MDLEPPSNLPAMVWQVCKFHIKIPQQLAYEYITTVAVHSNRDSVAIVT